MSTGNDWSHADFVRDIEEAHARETGGSRYAEALRCVTDALWGVPKKATAKEIDRIVYEVYPWPPRKGYPYKAWRRAVRDVQAARARLARWEGRDPGPIAPRRRSRASGVT